MKTQNSFRQILLAAGVALAVLLMPATSQAVTLTKANTTTLNASADWNAGAGPAPTSADLLTWQSSPITAANNIALTLGGDISCLSLDLRPNGTADPSLKIGSGNILNLGSNGANQSKGAWDTMFNCTINLIGNVALNIQGSMIINGSITQSGGNWALNKNSSSGALHLTAANSYGGGQVQRTRAAVLVQCPGAAALRNAAINNHAPLDV